jgi:hypothetical protein
VPLSRQGGGSLRSPLSLCQALGLLEGEIWKDHFALDSASTPAIARHREAHSGGQADCPTITKDSVTRLDGPKTIAPVDANTGDVKEAVEGNLLRVSDEMCVGVLSVFIKN